MSRAGRGGPELASCIRHLRQQPTGSRQRRSRQERPPFVVYDRRFQDRMAAVIAQKRARKALPLGSGFWAIAPVDRARPDPYL